MGRIITNCVITHEDSEILKEYDVKTGSKVYHTGVDIKATTLYTPCQGVCIFTGLVSNKPSCTIQYSQNICIRYTHLKEVSIEAGQLVEYNQNIGIADKYVHFEYLTSEPIYPSFRVFFCATVSYYMYKHDPMLILEGNVVFDNSYIRKTDDSDERWKAYQVLKDIDEDFFSGNDQYAFLNSDLLDDLK